MHALQVAMGVLMNLAAILGAMGTNGDKTVGHLTPGEIVIPREIVDNHPAVLPAIIKAFAKAGLNWREFEVGGPDDKMNPNTGMRAFYDSSTGSDAGPGGEGGSQSSAGSDSPGSSDSDGGMSGNDYGGDMGYGTGGVGPGAPGYGDQGSSEASPGAPSSLQEFWDRFKEMQQLQLEPTEKNPGLLSVFGLAPGVGMAMTATAIANALGMKGVNQTPEETFASLAQGEGSVISPARVESILAAIKGYSKPSSLTTPTGLDLETMTPLQQRAAIATRATQGTDSRYRDQSVYDYYDNLLNQALVSDTGELADYKNVLNPVESSFLNFRGLNSYDSTASLLDAIAAA